jgi:hypothetical protein
VAISFVGSLPTVAATNGGNVTLTFTNLRDAAGVQPTLLQNDVVFAIFAWGNTADYTAPTISGWTLLDDKYSNGSTNDTNLAVYYKRMTASPDTAVTATGPGGAANSSIGVAFALRGVDTTTAIDNYVSGTHSTTGTGTGAINPLAITPASAGAWIAVVGALANPIGAALTNGGDLSATTNHYRSGTSPDTTDISVGVGLKTDWVSGAFDPAAWAGGGTRAAGDSWAAITFSVKAHTAASHVGESSLTATGSMTAAGSKTSEGAASLSALGSLASEGLVAKPGAAALSAAGSLASEGLVSKIGEAALSSVGSLTADATVIGETFEGATELQCAGSLVVAGLITKEGASSLTAAGSLVIEGIVAKDGAIALSSAAALLAGSTLSTADSATLSTSSSLSGTGLVVREGAAPLGSAATLAAATTQELQAAAAIAAVATLDVNGTIIGGTSTYEGAANLGSSVSATSTALVEKVGSAELGCAATIAADGVVPLGSGSAILSGVSGLAVLASIEASGEAALEAVAEFAASGTTGQVYATPDSRTSTAEPPARTFTALEVERNSAARRLPRTTYAAKRTA